VKRNLFLKSDGEKLLRLVCHSGQTATNCTLQNLLQFCSPCRNKYTKWHQLKTHLLNKIFTAYALHKMPQCIQMYSALNAYLLLSGRIHQLHPSPHPHLVHDSFVPHIMYFSTLLATGHNLIIYNDITLKDRTQLELFLQAFPGREFMFLWIIIPNSSRVKAWSLKAASKYRIVNYMSHCSQSRQGT